MKVLLVINSHRQAALIQRMVPRDYLRIIAAGTSLVGEGFDLILVACYLYESETLNNATREYVNTVLRCRLLLNGQLHLLGDIA